ncbi:MAG: hypothetical protein C4547_05655 [Phycisphaerales bacterium]|nr:MAG: hypothetical protein C4547_05655 [Phycisphaerales bacterium]
MAAGCARGPAFHETLGWDGIVTRVGLEDPLEAVPWQVHAWRMSQHENYVVGDDGRMRVRTVALTDSQAGYDPFIDRDCPPQGSARSTQTLRHNRLKNRTAIPRGWDVDRRVTLQAVRTAGNDRRRWNDGDAATLYGYVRAVRAVAHETCNCLASTRELTTAQLEITDGPDDLQRPVIVHVTPPMRLIHNYYDLESWATRDVKAMYEGRWVTVTGWLMFNEMQDDGADNSDRFDWIGRDNWRASAWELHPVTHIELAEDPNYP